MPVFTNNIMWYQFLMICTEWIGTPYKHFKMQKGYGADCALFIAACLKEIGILKEIVYKYYPRFWHKVTSREVILDHIAGSISENMENGFEFKKIDKDNKLMRGDLITFSLRSKVTNHIAIYLDNKLILNSINGRGVCIMPLGNIYKNRITNIFRIYKEK